MVARLTSIQIEELTGEKPLPENFFSPTKSNIIEIPIIEWKQLAEIETIQPNQHIPVLIDISKSSFAVAMNDSSMEPLFPKGCLLIIVREKEPFDRAYVLTKLTESNIFIFRQLLIDADHRFLTPINPDLSRYSMKPLKACD